MDKKVELIVTTGDDKKKMAITPAGLTPCSSDDESQKMILYTNPSIKESFSVDSVSLE